LINGHFLVILRLGGLPDPRIRSMMRPECSGKDATKTMGGWLVEGRWPGALPVLLLVACSSGPSASARDVADANDTGRTLAGKSESERALLSEAGTLPSGTQRRIRSTTVIADAPYSSASGRTCRVLHVSEVAAKRPAERLACSDGKSWFFVPDVFGSPTDTGQE
jgi:hypothetical protein